MLLKFKLPFTLVLLLLSQLSIAQIGTIISRKQPKSELKENIGKSDVEIKIINLSKHITKTAETDADKSHAIFKWIATNITYDTALQVDKNLQKTIYTNEENVLRHVLTRNKALCGGYAFLFKKMCESVNIESQVIHGFTKTKGVKRKHNRVHHTWNVVKIDSSWKLIDITWAISRGGNGRPNEFWYNTSPQDFIKSHLPEKPQWTLLEGSKSLDEFDNK